MGRLTLARSLGVIALIAVVFAAMRNPGRDWEAIFIASAGGMFALAIASLIRKRGRDAVLIGFVVGGGSYFVAAVLLAGAIGPMPVTSSMLYEVALWLDPPAPMRAPDPPQTKSKDLTLEEQLEKSLRDSMREIKYLPMEMEHVIKITIIHESMDRIGQSLLSLVFGTICGGILGLASRFWRRSSTTRDLSIAAQPPSE